MSHLHSNYGYDEREAEIKEQEQLDRYDRILQVRYKHGRKNYETRIVGGSPVEHMINEDLRLMEEYMDIDPYSLRAVSIPESPYTAADVNTMTKQYNKNVVWSSIVDAIISCEKETTTLVGTIDAQMKQAISIARILNPGIMDAWRTRNEVIKEDIRKTLDGINKAGQSFRHNRVDYKYVMNKIDAGSRFIRNSVETYNLQAQCYARRMKNLVDSWNGRNCRDTLAIYRSVCEKNNAEPVEAYQRILKWCVSSAKHDNTITLAFTELKESSIIYDLVWFAGKTDSFGVKTPTIQFVFANIPDVITASHKLMETAQGIIMLIAFLLHQWSKPKRKKGSPKPQKLVTVDIKLRGRLKSDWPVYSSFSRLDTAIEEANDKYPDVCTEVYGIYSRERDAMKQDLTFVNYTKKIVELASLAHIRHREIVSVIETKQREEEKRLREAYYKQEYDAYRLRMAQEQEASRKRKELRDRQQLEERIAYHAAIYDKAQSNFGFHIDRAESAINAIRSLTKFSHGEGETVIGLKKENIAYWPYFCWLITMSAMNIKKTYITPGNIIVSTISGPRHMYAMLACLMERNPQFMVVGMNLRVQWDAVPSSARLNNILTSLHDIFLKFDEDE